MECIRMCRPHPLLLMIALKESQASNMRFVVMNGSVISLLPPLPSTQEEVIAGLACPRSRLWFGAAPCSQIPEGSLSLATGLALEQAPYCRFKRGSKHQTPQTENLKLECFCFLSPKKTVSYHKERYASRVKSTAFRVRQSCVPSACSPYSCMSLAESFNLNKPQFHPHKVGLIMLTAGMQWESDDEKYTLNT